MALTETDAIQIHDPASGEFLASVPIARDAAVDAAVLAARAAQPAWARTAAAERGAALKRIAAALRERADELAEIQTREGGKPIDDSRGGVEAGIATIEQYAELGPLHRGRSLVGAWAAHDAMVHEPRGVVAVITPWNDPVANCAGQLAAVLVTGNAAVFKPSERTPLCCVEVAAIFAEQLPDDVLQTLTGDATTGSALVAHPGVDVVLHTGSTTSAREIGVACAQRGAKAILESGGNDAMIVDAGVDPAWAAEQAASGAFANAGQICTAVERVYVHEAVAEAFVDELVHRAGRLRMGAGLEPGTELGPLVDERMRETVDAHVRDAVARGARVLCGGAPADGDGCFYPATVLVDVPADADVLREETFGPVAPVVVVASFDEAIERANATPYGLAATVLTCEMEHAARACRELRAGTVKVNAVWGGAPGGAAHPRGISGEGFGYGPELLDELTAVKVLHVEPGVRSRG
jgi:acyl-CoA reductase-like NAD-dependent aldehyde dehydrogenase